MDTDQKARDIKAAWKKFSGSLNEIRKRVTRIRQESSEEQNRLKLKEIQKRIEKL